LRAVRAVKKAMPELKVYHDVALILHETTATTGVLTMALDDGTQRTDGGNSGARHPQAQAGVDFGGPYGNDGRVRVGAIRKAAGRGWLSRAQGIWILGVNNNFGVYGSFAMRSDVQRRRSQACSAKKATID